METLLVHADAAQSVLVPLAARLAMPGLNCEAVSGPEEWFRDPASEADWGEEYLGPILSIRIVDDMPQILLT